MLENVANALPAAFRDTPINCALVLGSGWGEALAEFPCHARISYKDLPGFGGSTVPGHHGELLLLTISNKRVLVFSGRRHYYEGCSLEQVVYPIELMRCLHVPVVLLTNAAGGLDETRAAGSFLVLRDHLNFTGLNPLRGEHREEWGPRFPDCTHVYDPELSQRLAACASPALPQGVYAFMTGPSFETPAEIKALRMLGADAVGMSTVPEAVFAHACGIRVVGLSCLTNLAAGISSTPLTHTEVLEHSERAKPQMKRLLCDFINSLE